MDCTWLPLVILGLVVASAADSSQRRDDHETVMENAKEYQRETNPEMVGWRRKRAAIGQFTHQSQSSNQSSLALARLLRDVTTTNAKLPEAEV